MGVSLIQTTPVDATTTNQSKTVTFGSSVTSGNLIIGYFTMVASNPGAPVFNGFSDNKGGNTWHTIITQITAKDASLNAFIQALGYTVVVNGGSSFQVTASNGDTIQAPCQTIAQEWSGFGASITIDDKQPANKISGATSTNPSVTLSLAPTGDLVVSIHGLITNTATAGTIGGVSANLISDGGGNGSVSEYGSTMAGSAIVTGGTSDTEWAIIAAGFKLPSTIIVGQSPGLVTACGF